MQQYTLQDPLYSEYYRAGELLMEEIQKHPKGKWAKEYGEFMELLDSTASFFGQSDPGEKHGRAMHHLLIHFSEKGFIREPSVCHERFPLLEEVEIMVYEILGTNIDLSVNIRDLGTGKVHRVEKEYKASEKSLLTLKMGTLVMSHIQRCNGEIVIMKNFFYIQEIIGSDEYYWFRAGLSNITTLMGCFLSLGETYKQMVENNQVDGKNMPSTETTSINYLKRIKKALESSLGKKMKFGSIEKKLHEHELDFENFIDFLGQQYPGVPYDMGALEIHFIGWRNEFEQKKKESKAGSIQRKGIILYAYHQTLSPTIIEEMKMKNPPGFESRFQIWMNTENHLFDGKTPTEFVREGLPDFVSTDLHSTIRFSQEEADFYGTYTGTFSVADDVLYRSVLNAQEHSDWKKMISLLEGLVVRHSDFFRIRYNLMAGKVNEISERYAGKNYTPTTEALKNDTAFLEGVEKEFQYIKHLAPYNYDACRPEQEVIFMNQVTRLMLGNWHKLFIGGRAKKAGEKQIAGCARPYYQLKIQLRNMRPSFYRTLLVDPSETFFGLHCRIQEMFGFYGYHLWSFDWQPSGWHHRDAGKHYLVQELFDEPMTDSGQIFSAEKTLISDFFREHDKIIYTYDFGDNWEFDITLEKEGTVDQETPLVIRAKGGMIPEDIGGRGALQAYFEYYQNGGYPEYWEETIEFEMDREDDPDILPKESFKNFFEENVLNAPDFDAFEWEDSKEVWKELIEMRNE